MSSEMNSREPNAALAEEPARTPLAPSGPPLTRWQKFRMVVKVVELRLRFIALMAATGLVFGYWDTIWNHYEKWTRPPGEAHAESSDVEFFCPMHPTVIQPEPGSCPICGMPLSKRKVGEKETLPLGVVSRIALAPMRVAQAGIQTSEVSYAPLSEAITTVGSVSYDERRLARISSKAKGMSRIEKLHVNFNGDSVKAGAPLANLYSPELNQAIQELLLAQRSAKERPQAQSAFVRSLLGSEVEMVNRVREKLSRWGITAKQVDEILAKGKAEYIVPILSPITGIVARKNVFEGQYVAEGDTMFEIADLSHVWVQAQVYENQFSALKLGQAVEASVEAYPGETFRGKVAFIAPALNSQTRTVDVRYDLENADYRLRPGMFATVKFNTPVADTPAFQSRLAASGPKESHAKPASFTVEAQKICPVTTLKLGAMGEPVSSDVEGRKVWTCCEACPPKLKAEPAKYLARLEPAPKDEVLTVPESAVIDTGTKKLVYVETDPGVFEGREVVLGPVSGDVYPVLEGLTTGEKVATAGSFLIDAENRLNPKIEGKKGEPPAPGHEATRSAAAPVAAAHRH
ncbi:efflux RND transporter periplasmic adaptor subunit [Singulisphaera sp. Ch08]|uniref:Efflux RND transporter periplasmic adaptor subunit n=1 Tax=Singulisphaera sp. Ch08 TaxID=3120278 RepID=A0AAU7CTK1_9BACT